ncbi:MAG: tRNA (guanosine(46)-N7)-methyltransferase TrmB [Bacilli bacterium]
MRLRNVKNKEDILKSSMFLVKEPEKFLGSWNNAFDNKNPIQIEIGMGKGRFIIEKALQNPDINYIGIEKYDSVIVRALEKIPKDLKNLRLIRMNALDIDKIFYKEVDTIYLNFSDPWPKKRHSFRRLTSPVFLEKYENIFVGCKKICQKTDNRLFFEYSIVNLNEAGYKIREISLDLHNSSVENNIMTEYESKFVQNGDKIYYLFAVK